MWGGRILSGAAGVIDGTDMVPYISRASWPDATPLDRQQCRRKTYVARAEK